MTKKKTYILIGYEYSGEDDYCAVEIYEGSLKECRRRHDNWFYSQPNQYHNLFIVEESKLDSFYEEHGYCYSW
jgi:hypothetical protein